MENGSSRYARRADMRRMLVTGAAGFIGSNFSRYWLDSHPEDHLVIVDALTYAGNRSSIEDLIGERCEFVHADINNTALMADLLREHKLDTIVHFAAESHSSRRTFWAHIACLRLPGKSGKWRVKHRIHIASIMCLPMRFMARLRRVILPSQRAPLTRLTRLILPVRHHRIFW